ncbi:MAG TPA: ATP-binding cassette domain-containing protein, partial [Vicinamibacterales bacterium]
MKLGRTARPPVLRLPGDTLIEARGVAARLGGVEILHGIDLVVHSGEVVGLAGPNGAGKSTLFGVLCGDIEASGGSVSLHGEPLAHWSFVERAQRRAVLPQQVTVSFPFLVRDVVAMGRAPW